jgi:putative nucleotidyltransferase with HDIG domain
VFDYASQFLMSRPVIGISAVAQLRSVLPAFAVDTLLAPLGLLVSFTTYAQLEALVLVLPVLLLFARFARERQHRIDNALELSTAYRGTAMLLGDVIEADDEYTGTHSRDVVDLVLAAAARLQLSPRDRQLAEFAALLHDVGKVKVSSEIINKTGPLDEPEWEIMKTHTVVGEQMLEPIGGLLGDVGLVVPSCHEWKRCWPWSSSRAHGDRVAPARLTPRPRLCTLARCAGSRSAASPSSPASPLRRSRTAAERAARLPRFTRTTRRAASRLGSSPDSGFCSSERCASCSSSRRCVSP